MAEIPFFFWGIVGFLNRERRTRTAGSRDSVGRSEGCAYKSPRFKQYFKQVPGVSQVGARTETTVNNPRDFYLGKRLGNLPALRQVGFQANRRLLQVEQRRRDSSESRHLPIGIH